MTRALQHSSFVAQEREAIRQNPALLKRIRPEYVQWLNGRCRKYRLPIVTKKEIRKNG